MDSYDTAQTHGNTLNRFHETSAKVQRYKVLLRRRWWFLLLTACIAVCYQALSITSKPTEYIAFGKIVAGTQVKLQNGDTGVNQVFTQDFYGTQIELLEAGKLKSNADSRVAASHPDLKPIDVDVQVTQTKGSSILNVSATGIESEYTRVYLDALLSEYLGFRKQMIEDSIVGTMNKVIEQVIIKNGLVESTRKQLDEFLRNNDATMFEAGFNRAGAYLVQLQNTLDMYETEKKLMEQMGLDNYLRQQSKGGGGTMPAMPAMADSTPFSVIKGGDGPKLPTTGSPMTQASLSAIEARYLDAKGELMFLEAKRESELAKYRPEHPIIKEMDEDLAEAKSRIAIFRQRCEDEMKGRFDAIETKIRGLKTAIQEWTIKAKEANDKIVMFKSLDNEYKRVLADHQDWKRKLDQLDTSNIVQSDLVAILERPGAASENRPALWLPLAMAMFLGIGAGSVILLLFDRLDDRMNTFSEFQALFPNEAILGQIPEQPSRGDVTLIRPSDDRHLYAEAFRNLRSSILFKNWKSGKPPKVILVTSAVPNEGKTTSVANMAITMALGGSRVLLADADLRRGGINELFKVPGTPGFSEVLSSRIHWRDAVMESGTKGLHLLPRGEAVDQASELFLSQLSDEIIREMADEYDYVVFDSAPVLVADDTASFAPKVDTVLFVVRMSSTMARLSAKALDALYDRQVNVGGIILNRSSTSLKEYTYYNYASYYSVGAKKGKTAEA